MNDQVLVLKTINMETINFDRLLLKTAFSCMACDGDIDKREIKLIKRLHKEKRLLVKLILIQKWKIY